MATYTQSLQDRYPIPNPVPTQYQPPDKGGNRYLVPGTTGPMLGTNAVPLMGPPDPRTQKKGMTTFSDGVSYPSNQVRPAPTAPQNINPVQYKPSAPTQSSQPQQSNNPSNADYDAVGVARGDRGGYERVMRELQSSRAREQEENMRRQEEERRRQEEERRRQEELERYRQEQESLLNQQVDSSFQGSSALLDAIEQDYKTQYPTAQEEINQQFSSSNAELGNEQATKVRGLDTQLQTAGMEQKSQISKARQLANELQQGIVTRRGGSSSVGQGMQEILGRETASQMGDINQRFGNTRQNIEKERADVNNYYATKKREFEEQKGLALRKIQETFDSKIRELNAQRTGLEGEKRAKKLGALKQLQQQIQQIKMEEIQYNRDLEQWKAWKDEALGLAREFKASSFEIPGFQNKFSGITIRPGVSSVAPQLTGGGGGITSAPRKEEYPGIDSTDPFFQ